MAEYLLIFVVAVDKVADDEHAGLEEVLEVSQRFFRDSLHDEFLDNERTTSTRLFLEKYTKAKQKKNTLAMIILLN